MQQNRERNPKRSQKETTRWWQALREEKRFRFRFLKKEENTSLEGENAPLLPKPPGVRRRRGAAQAQNNANQSNWWSRNITHLGLYKRLESQNIVDVIKNNAAYFWNDFKRTFIEKFSSNPKQYWQDRGELEVLDVREGPLDRLSRGKEYDYESLDLLEFNRRTKAEFKSLGKNVDRSGGGSYLQPSEYLIDIRADNTSEDDAVYDINNDEREDKVTYYNTVLQRHNTEKASSGAGAKIARQFVKATTPIAAATWIIWSPIVELFSSSYHNSKASVFDLTYLGRRKLERLYNSKPPKKGDRNYSKKLQAYYADKKLFRDYMHNDAPLFEPWVIPFLWLYSITAGLFIELPIFAARFLLTFAWNTLRPAAMVVASAIVNLSYFLVRGIANIIAMGLYNALIALPLFLSAIIQFRFSPDSRPLARRVLLDYLPVVLVTIALVILLATAPQLMLIGFTLGLVATTPVGPAAVLLAIVVGAVLFGFAQSLAKSLGSLFVYAMDQSKKGKGEVNNNKDLLRSHLNPNPDNVVELNISYLPVLRLLQDTEVKIYKNMADNNGQNNDFFIKIQGQLYVLGSNTEGRLILKPCKYPLSANNADNNTIQGEISKMRDWYPGDVITKASGNNYTEIHYIKASAFKKIIGDQRSEDFFVRDSQTGIWEHTPHAPKNDKVPLMAQLGGERLQQIQQEVERLQQIQQEVEPQQQQVQRVDTANTPSGTLARNRYTQFPESRHTGQTSLSLFENLSETETDEAFNPQQQSNYNSTNRNPSNSLVQNSHATFTEPRRTGTGYQPLYENSSKNETDEAFNPQQQSNYNSTNRNPSNSLVQNPHATFTEPRRTGTGYQPLYENSSKNETDEAFNPQQPNQTTINSTK